MSYNNAISDLSAAMGHACYQGFSVYSYTDRDWEKYVKWRDEIFRKLSKEEQKIAYEQERATGIPMEPADCRITMQRDHTPHDVIVEGMFFQTWSSTALGFGGVGGQAITDAYTIVLRSELTGECCVYFGGRLAYRIDRPNSKFFEDLCYRVMADRARAKGLYERPN